jgi:hypothetical protein
MPTALKEVTTKNLGGRQSKFHTKLLPLTRKLASIAATEVEIADALGIDYGTYLRWQAEYPQFARALELGKAKANKRVIRALYHRAIGYTHDAVKIFKTADDTPLIVPYREHVPPDTNAAQFWLKNRQPDQWRDKIDIEGRIEIGLADSIAAARGRLLKSANPPTLEANTGNDIANSSE